MNRLLVLVVALGALACVAPALAKGPAEATITGPGIKGGAIHLKSGGGDPMSGTPLGSLAEDGGFYPAAYGQSPDPMVRTRPRGVLGPKYDVEYRVPGPNGRTDTIRQELYPYASIGPVTYMKPGQLFWGDMKTHGGWYVGAPALKSQLVKAGLSATPPSGGSSDGWAPSWSFVTMLAVAVGLAGAAFVAVRRRPRPAGA
jgi:hypothetical protein